MHVRLTHFALPPEKVEEITRVYHEEIAPVIQQQPGIANVLLFEPVNDADEFISCTTWNSEADLKAFESSDIYKVVFGKIKAAAVSAAYQKYYRTRK